MAERTPVNVSPAIWRTVDASINRASEGLRLLEDLVRFSLNESHVCQQLKNIRHYLSQVAAPWQRELLSSRDSKGDIGRESSFDEESKRDDVLSLVSSNAKRVQEALRTLEELGKLPGMDKVLDWTKLKEFRFLAYELEKDILCRFYT